MALELIAPRTYTEHKLMVPRFHRSWNSRFELVLCSSRSGPSAELSNRSLVGFASTTLIICSIRIGNRKVPVILTVISFNSWPHSRPCCLVLLPSGIRLSVFFCVALVALLPMGIDSILPSRIYLQAACFRCPAQLTSAERTLAYPAIASGARVWNGSGDIYDSHGQIRSLRSPLILSG